MFKFLVVAYILNFTEFAFSKSREMNTNSGDIHGEIKKLSCFTDWRCNLTIKSNNLRC